MDATPLPHITMAASVLLGYGLRIAAQRAHATDEGARGKLAGLTILALGLGVAVALWSGNYAALATLNPDAAIQALVDLSVWVLGITGPMLAPAKERT